MAGEIIDIRKRALEKHRSNFVSFVKEPRGIFDWIDTSIQIFREANKETIEAIRSKVGTRTSVARSASMPSISGFSLKPPALMPSISGYSLKTSELIEKIKSKLGIR